jgi:ABC-type branched-subunit amino acid transport system substrate-binding protein
MLFSRSGATGLTEAEHVRGAELAFAELNARGGVMGRPVEVVALDPASDMGLYRAHAERLMTDEAVSVIFGCHTSDSRKAVLRSLERRNGLLWYPSTYEGFEYSVNVLYTGPVANQCAYPLARYALAEHGPRFYFAGCDYVFPRATNRVMRDLVEAGGGEVAGETYVPMLAPTATLERLLVDIRRVRPDVIFSTMVGETGRAFCRMRHEAGIAAPVASLTLMEGEVAAVGAEACAGFLTAASYFAPVATDENARFRRAFADRFGADRPVSGWSAASYAQVGMFARALEIAGGLDPERLAQAAQGMEHAGPEGPILIDPDNNHAWLTPRIGRVNAQGGFDIVWDAGELVRPDPYLATSPMPAAAS